MANLQTTLRQEATNESLTENTNANGEVVFNLDNLPSDFTVGDKITVFTLYKGYQASVSHTITSGGGVTLSLTLAALPSAPSLRYYAPQDFLDYYRMKTYEEDTENGIRMQQLVKIGEMVEGGIDDDTGTKFDDNDGSYYTVTDEFLDAEKNQSVFFLRNLPVRTLKTFYTNKADEDSNPNWDNLRYISLDNCDTATNWSASSDNSEPSVAINLVPNNANEGVGSVYIAKSGSNDTTLTFERTSLSATNFNDRDLKIDLYLDDTDDLASSDAVFIRFGSSSSAYFQKAFDRADLADGWNSLAMNSTDTDLTVTGSPDITACDYFVIILELVSAATTLTSGDARLDDLRYEEQHDITLNADRGRVKINNKSDYPEEGVDQVKATYTYGRSTVPLDIKELAILETGLHLFGASFMRSKIRGTLDARHDFTAWFDSFRNRIIMKYNVTGMSSVFGGGAA